MRTKTVRGTRKLLLLTLVPAVALAGGCTDASAPDPTPAAPDPASAVETAQLQARPGRGIDAEFTRLAREVPGFGGMHYDNSGRLNVYLKSQPGAALRAADMVGRLRAVGGPAVQD